MEHIIRGMRKTIAELITWQSEHPDVPESVKQAIRSYREEMINSIESLVTPPFQVDDRVELISRTYEDGGYYPGDTGTVVDMKSAVLPSGHAEHEIRVRWDNGGNECWIDASDFTEQ